MNATNKELYDLVLKDWPYVVAAYSVLWVALVVYLTMILRRLTRMEKEMTVLEESVGRRSEGQA